MNPAARTESARPAHTTAIVPSGPYVVFLALLAFQGFHLVEHVTQVVQRYFLGIANGNGILGSVADIEPVHFAYNLGYLALLIAVYLLLGLARDGANRVGRPVYVLLTFTLAFQGFHVLEHVVKMAQYLQMGLQNGTGGIFGMAPGGLAPLFPVPLLHLGYNAIGYLPAVVAFVILLRQARFTPSGR